MFESTVKKTFGWLNADRAKRISDICKKYGAKTQRLAQERKALGVCKVIATFRQFPGWYDNAKKAAEAMKEIEAENLTNSLTFYGD